MISHTTNIKVRYSDTDQMGFVHHSNYCKYYETARWELLRAIGVSYQEIERIGIIMPVIDMRLHFIKPAFCDEELLVNTSILHVKGARMTFQYQLVNPAGEIINEAQVSVAFVNKDTYEPCHPPDFLTIKLKNSDA
jgi:acyl-CoA thioester hydrolase